jgi:RND family efflux transporter MFP subunit
MKRSLSIFLSIMGAVSLLALAACTSEQQRKSEAASVIAQSEAVRNVAVFQTAAVRVPDMLLVLGTVHASETSQLAAQMMGTVVTVNVREGDTVKRGQVLAVIDASQAQAGLNRAQAAWKASQHELTAAQSERALADSTLQRYATLFERKSVSPQEYDEVKARQQGAAAHTEAAASAEEQAKAAVAQAKSVLGYTRILAPFDGVVTERKVDPGAMAAPGMPLLTLEGTGRYRVDAAVDEGSLRLVQIGATVPVSLDAYPPDVYPDAKFEGRVTQIVPAVDPATRTFLVKIELPHSPLIHSGLSARASFSRGSRDALLIPQTAVVDRGALKAVYIVGADQIASLRYVTVGEPTGGLVEVLSGLSPQESVIKAPADRELGGRRVLAATSAPSTQVGSSEVQR